VIQKTKFESFEFDRIAVQAAQLGPAIAPSSATPQLKRTIGTLLTSIRTLPAC
jgi:hypothetical protein